ncbi:tRNA pseudouridine(38-40) synthase TruA [Candidatus Spongiihabitans sp.]|uniref:tRNA pseudouridine(38-40) synthase TruA n=1 Tax=Candidatus Spongiihabitans sp. TaxID=3101308 RepID=UPI003C7D8F82
MIRLAACVEYCGRNYCGWQRQAHSPSVQQAVENAISKVADEPITVLSAGRTDTGVHGIGQIIHFDTQRERTQNEWLRGVNTHLPDDISLVWTRPVGNDFHARFGARQRRYRYVILNRPVSPSYLHGLVAWHYTALDLFLMQRAAKDLVGRHDFSAYRAAGCQSKDPVKEVCQLTLEQSGPWIWMDITADGFLQHMVRNIVGVLMRIGERLESVHWAQQILESRDRKIGGVTAVADGLYFVSVDYDAKFGLPNPPEACRFW